VVVCVGRVRLAAAALREPATDEVAGCDDRDVQPGLASDELVGAAGVAALDGRGAIRTPTTTATNAYSSLLLVDCFVSVVRRGEADRSVRAVGAAAM